MEILDLKIPVAEATTATGLASHNGRQSGVAIGAFDGVHLGHRQVLVGCDTVLTFDPHPMHVLAPRPALRLLSDRRTKLRKLEALGIRRVAIIPFDEGWSRVTADDFVERVVIDRLHASRVSVGANFRFGAHGVGTPETFNNYQSLQTRVVQLVQRGPGAEPISSTRIRKLVAAGNVEGAIDLLGGPFSLPAVAVSESRLVIADDFALPAPGLYSAQVDGNAVSLRTSIEGVVELTHPASLQRHTTVEVSFLSRIA